MRHLLSCVLFFLLVACTVPEVASPAPTPEAIFVSYPVALQPWVDKLAQCSSDYPQAALYIQTSLEPIPVTPLSKMTLQLGESPQITAPGYLSQVGDEQIVLIVNRKNSLTGLTSDELQAIYSGQVSRWENDAEAEVEVWAYPAGDPVRENFDQVVLHSRKLTTNAMLAPDPAAMLEAVAQDAGSIGYLPQSFLSESDKALTDKVKIVDLIDKLAEKLKLPVIAITQSEPQGNLRNLLVCLQNKPPQ